MYSEKDKWIPGTIARRNEPVLCRVQVDPMTYGGDMQIR